MHLAVKARGVWSLFSLVHTVEAAQIMGSMTIVTYAHRYKRHPGCR